MDQNCYIAVSRWSRTIHRKFILFLRIFKLLFASPTAYLGNVVGREVRSLQHF